MSGNRIHPTVVMEGDVDLGVGNVVMPYAVILGPCRLGDDNWIGSHAITGANRVGMKRAGFDESDIDLLDAHYRASGAEPINGEASDRVRELFTMYETRLLQRVSTDT